MMAVCMMKVVELRDSVTLLEASKFKLEKALQQSEMKTAALEQQVIDKAELVLKAQELQGMGARQLQHSEAALEKRGSHEALLTDKLKASVREINKGNDIIKQMRADQRSVRSKLRLKSQVIREQERLIEGERQRVAEIERV